MAKKKRPRDVNQLAKQIVDEATGETTVSPLSARSQPAVHRVQLGGLEGGKARAAHLDQAMRSENSKQAALARWSKKPKT